MSDKELEKPARRDLLKSLFLGAAAAGAAGMSSGAVRAATPEPEEASSGYRESEHVLRYYELADD